MAIDRFLLLLCYSYIVITRKKESEEKETIKMKNNLTELVFVLDMSGSMDHLTDDTIGGFNSVIRDHNDGNGEVLVTTYLFNNDSRMIHDRLSIAEVPKMTEKEYRASGCTALLDTLGDAIQHIVGIHRYARDEDIPAHTIFVIMTDGMENASHRFSSERVKKMIRHEQEKYSWEFIFLAANIDAVETAEMYGIDESRAVNYHADDDGTMIAYRSVSAGVRNARTCGSVLAEPSWRRDADEDYKKRKK